MESRFLVEAKSFVLSILDGASILQVKEKREGFFGEIPLSNQCTDWLSSTMEALFGFPGGKEFVKSFREGLKVLIVRGGWGRHKFACKLRKAKDYFFFCYGRRRGWVFVFGGEGGWEGGDGALVYRGGEVGIMP
jgi:hypothetical protein